MKLIVSDVDGTLVLDGSHVINPAYYDVIQKIRSRGNIFVVASGRQYHSIANLFAPIADSEDFWAIAEGGAAIYHDGRIVNQETIDPALVDEMLSDIQILHKKGVDVMLSTARQAYCPYEDSELYRWMTDSYRYEIAPTGGFGRLPREGILKVAIYHPFNCEAVCREWFYDKWEKRMMLAGAGDRWVDCVQATSTKGASLKRLQQLVNVTPADTIVFGDNYNDIPMFHEAGLSYAVGNAAEAAKEAATKVIGTHWENGVLQELEQLLQDGTLD